MSVPAVDIPIQFNRVNPFGIQSNEQFTTLPAATAYALCPTAVIGQILQVVTDNPLDPIRNYQIQRDKSLKLLEFTGGAGDATGVEMGGSFTVTNPLGIAEGTVISSTDDVFGVLKGILNPLVPPTYVAPTLSLAGSTPLAVEYGASISPTLTPTWTQNNGGALSRYQLFRGAAQIFDGATATPHADTPFSITANTTYHARADFAIGAILDDSDGNPDATGRIAAGYIESGDVTYVVHRRSFFGRITNNTLATAALWLGAANTGTIRALVGGALNPASGTKLTMTFQPGDYGGVFAYPASLPAPASIMSRNFPVNMIGAFTESSKMVEGDNESTAVAYRVFCMINSAPFTSEDQYTLTIG